MPLFIKDKVLDVQKLVPLNGEVTKITHLSDLDPAPPQAINTNSSNSVVDTSQQFNDLLRN